VNFLSAEPPTLVKGQAFSLRWSVKDAQTVAIDNGVGPVAADDRRELRPTVTTTYNLQATRGNETAGAAVTVTVTDSTATSATTTSSSALTHVNAETLASTLKDIHFLYGEEKIIQEEKPILESNAAALKEVLKEEPTLAIMIEGHCDERGSAEYNIGLGDRRANFIKTTLVTLGIPDSNLTVVSFGKEHPVCLDNTESCFANNRRAHFALAQ
jgi:peptidoglycan-associated lipoprotein